MTTASESAGQVDHAGMAWLWGAGYAILTLPFLPLWPDFEIARRGLGAVLGAAALLALLWTPRPMVLPPRILLLWLGVVAIHGLTCAFAHNPGDGLARTAWLLSLGAFAALAARTTSLATQVAAVTWTGIGVAAFGLAQALGLVWPLGYSVVDDAVSTLGNRNVAAEVSALAVVAAAIVVLRAHRPLWPAVAVALGAAYLGVNESRSGLLATSLTVIPLVLAPWRQHPGRRRALLLAMVLLGVAAAVGIRSTRSVPAREPAAPPAAAPGNPASTIEVRLQLWSAGLRMLRDAPWVGVGAGQFKVAYPRYRSQREIELSTGGRTFAAAPRTAHNDPLEIAIETGTLGLALYVAFWFAVLQRRGRHAPIGLLPITAFLILGLVRSPLANAPAAAFAFACVGAVCRTRREATATAIWPRRALGSCLAAGALWVGTREGASQCAAVPYVDQARQPAAEQSVLVQMHALDRAVGWCPWDGPLRALRCRLRADLAIARQDPAALRALTAPGGDVDVLLRHTPFSTTNRMIAAKVFQHVGDGPTTERLLNSILAIDPPNPEARLFLATRFAEQSDAPRAIAALFGDGAPHPSLRRDLARHFRDLAALPRGTGADLLQREADFVTAADALAHDAPAAEAIKRFVAHFVTATDRKDLRPLALIAVGLLRTGDPADAKEADRAGAEAPADARLDPVHARFLADLLLPLRALPSWQRRLPSAAAPAVY